MRLRRTLFYVFFTSIKFAGVFAKFASVSKNLIKLVYILVLGTGKCTYPLIVNCSTSILVLVLKSLMFQCVVGISTSSCA